ncbi:DUF3990 domain-containing protein [Altererythrobacter gangjinensis]|uniref:DUF3990 domain-containing protein n=1 Tax=Pontixanthobacter gangjinensis TaxID=1028742 RepID=A0A6I4SHT8_9SPHN|nr:DUF3990 domain-containing protein [Pontixanthobacter gangjinensis]
MEAEEGSCLDSFKVDLAKCKSRTDFGKGFYLTSSLDQAKNWANVLLHRLLFRRRGEVIVDKAVVLEFVLNSEELAKLDNLWFVRPEHNFHSFVARCREHDVWHKENKNSPPYDTVAGPVTLYPQEQLVHDADQFSFHTSRAASILNTPTIRSLGSFETGKFQTAYMH